MEALKKIVYDHFLQVVNQRLLIIANDLNDLASSADNETKSTAGDKHETALAMLQIEQANKNKQRDELLAQKAVMEKIDPAIKTVSIVQGSLVKTQQHYFFISAALGKKVIDGKLIFAISSLSPIGQKMMGLEKCHDFSMGDANYIIEDLY